MNNLKDLESGQGMVEYGLILVLVAMGSVIVLSIIGSNSIFNMYEKVRTLFESL